MFFLILLLLASTADADFSVDHSISILGGIDTNSLYMESSSGVDGLMKIDPELSLMYEKKTFLIKTGGDIDYQRYFKNSNQSNFSWFLNNGLELMPSKSTQIEFVDSYGKNSDPILLDTETRARWRLHTLKVNAHYKRELWYFSGSFELLSRRYDLSTFENFDNSKKYFSVLNKFHFFPETAFVFGVKVGTSSYPAGINAVPYGNSNSIHYEGFVGLEGKITRTVKMNLKLGMLWLDYKYGTNFHEPIFLAEFIDIISRSCSLSARYERMAYDSVYSNFFVDQKISLELKSIWKDNFINLTTFQYIYRYYREAPARVDHKLAFITELAYPIFIFSGIDKNVSLVMRFLAEWVNSDAYNIYGLYTGPDLSVNYRKFFLLFGVTTKY